MLRSETRTNPSMYRYAIYCKDVSRSEMGQDVNTLRRIVFFCAISWYACRLGDSFAKFFFDSFVDRSSSVAGPGMPYTLWAFTFIRHLENSL